MCLDDFYENRRWPREVLRFLSCAVNPFGLAHVPNSGGKIRERTVQILVNSPSPDVEHTLVCGGLPRRGSWASDGVLMFLSRGYLVFT